MAAGINITKGPEQRGESEGPGMLPGQAVDH